jgi:AcrR family transcriptional regulator
MALFWQLLPFFLVAWLLTLLIPVRINILFLRKNRDDLLAVRVETFCSALRLKLEVPVLRQDDLLDLELEAELKTGTDRLLREEAKRVSGLDILEQIRIITAYLYRHKRQFWFMARLLARAVTVEKFTLHVAGGTRDAALTGMLAGLYWTAGETLAALAGRWLKLRGRPQFCLSPDFGRQPTDAIRVDTTVSLYIGHFVLLGIMLVNIKIR